MPKDKYLLSKENLKEAQRIAKEQGREMVNGRNVTIDKGLAALLDRDKRQISNYKSGKTHISSELLARIAAALQVTPEFLTGRDSYPNEDYKARGEIQKKNVSTRVSVQRVLHVLLSFGYGVIFTFTDKEGEVFSTYYTDDDQQVIMSKASKNVVEQDHFFRWTENGTATIKIYQGPSPRWISLRTVLISREDHYMELSLNDFLKLIYDIESSINSRMTFWNDYHGYSFANTASGLWYEG